MRRCFGIHHSDATIDRGGRSYDTENFVSLVKDMRAAFGQDFGKKRPIHPTLVDLCVDLLALSQA